jgi:hypothetical protein
MLFPVYELISKTEFQEVRLIFSHPTFFFSGGEIFTQVYFCDRMRWNAIPEALSQKDTSRNGVPEPFLSWHRYNEVGRVLLSSRSSF